MRRCGRRAGRHIDVQQVVTSDLLLRGVEMNGSGISSSSLRDLLQFTQRFCFKVQELLGAGTFRDAFVVGSTVRKGRELNLKLHSPTKAPIEIDIGQREVIKEPFA